MSIVWLPILVICKLIEFCVAYCFIHHFMFIFFQGMKILTGSWVATNALQEWNYTEGKLNKNIPFDYKGHDGAYLYCSQFCDNDVVVAGGSGTNNVQAINTVTGEVSLSHYQNQEQCQDLMLLCFLTVNQSEFSPFPLCRLLARYRCTNRSKLWTQWWGDVY